MEMLKMSNEDKPKVVGVRAREFFSNGQQFSLPPAPARSLVFRYKPLSFII
jgi:hypothetical protein